jgi:hypothetical protein
MVRLCSMHGRDKKRVQNFSENKGKSIVGRARNSTDGRIILKWNLRK